MASALEPRLRKKSVAAVTNRSAAKPSLALLHSENMWPVCCQCCYSLMPCRHTKDQAILKISNIRQLSNQMDMPLASYAEVVWRKNVAYPARDRIVH
jgi:hypothetical protein